MPMRRGIFPQLSRRALACNYVRVGGNWYLESLLWRFTIWPYDWQFPLRIYNLVAVSLLPSFYFFFTIQLCPLLYLGLLFLLLFHFNLLAFSHFWLFVIFRPYTSFPYVCLIHFKRFLSVQVTIFIFIRQHVADGLCVMCGKDGEGSKRSKGRAYSTPFLADWSAVSLCVCLCLGCYLRRIFDFDFPFFLSVSINLIIEILYELFYIQRRCLSLILSPTRAFVFPRLENHDDHDHDDDRSLDDRCIQKFQWKRSSCLGDLLSQDASGGLIIA